MQATSLRYLNNWATATRAVGCGLLLCFWILPSPALAEGPRWQTIENGFEFRKYELGDRNSVIRPEVYLLKFDPKYFYFSASTTGAPTSGETFPAADIRTLTRQVGGIAGINANFFDEQGRPLGLLIQDSVPKQRIHKGGRVLTGVFSFDQHGVAKVMHRDSFVPDGVVTAVQAGPRIIDGGKPIPITASEETSRRSGVAITRDRKVILYATVLRFPGASLSAIQQMLLDPALGVMDALNFDGGSSSQLFIEAFANLRGETFISGGDAVPVGIVVKRRSKDDSSK